MFDVGTRDALLAVGHHLSVFVFTAFLAIEVALLRVRLGAPGLSVLSFFTFVPGIRIQRWHKAAAADPAYEVSTSDLTYVRRALWVEVALLLPVPICAALMARGYGMF